MNEEFNKVIIGTHNSMSFLKPKHWWMRPINWLFAQCQDDETDVFNGGCMDIRVYWDNDVWRFAHGLVSYEFGVVYYDIYRTISIFAISGVRYFRIILERLLGAISRISANFLKLIFFSSRLFLTN